MNAQHASTMLNDISELLFSHNMRTLIYKYINAIAFLEFVCEKVTQQCERKLSSVNKVLLDEMKVSLRN